MAVRRVSNRISIRHTNQVGSTLIGGLVASKARIRSGFTLGGEQAEADPFSSEAFVETGLYEVLAD